MKGATIHPVTQTRNSEAILNSSFLINSHKKFYFPNISEIHHLYFFQQLPQPIALLSDALLVKIFPLNPFSTQQPQTYIRNHITWFVPVAQSVTHVWLLATPWTAARRDSLSFTISQRLLKLMSTESVMPSNHLILCCPLLFLPSILPSTRVFSSESALNITW